MNIYLAGSMSGKEDHNFPAFFEAAQKLRDEGHTVFSPAEADLAEYVDQQAINDDVAKRGKMTIWRERIQVDFDWIINYADAIAIIPGWEDSYGVNAELALSRALNLEVRYL